ncbi:hypothetical protein P8X24_03240 [Pyrococcus kukulkanii]
MPIEAVYEKENFIEASFGKIKKKIHFRDLEEMYYEYILERTSSNAISSK